MANSPAEVRGTRLALNSGVIAVGLAVSPTVSGFALTQFGWRSMFVVSLAIDVYKRQMMAFLLSLMHPPFLVLVPVVRHARSRFAVCVPPFFLLRRRCARTVPS